MRSWIVACLGLALFAPWSVAVAQETIAFEGGTLWTGEGPAIDDGVLIVRGDRVISVGERASIVIPADARRVDCAGATLTPGLIGTQTPFGLVEISMEASSSDRAPTGDDAPALRPAFDAADAYHPLSTLIPIARRGGVTSVVSTPQGGLIAGTSAFVDLIGRRPAESLVERASAIHIDLGDGGVDAAGGARPAALGRLREAFIDARLYSTRRRDYERRALRPLSLSAAGLERLAQAFDGLPLVVNVSRSSDILRVLAFAAEQRVQIVLAGAEEGWMVADAIADADVPVIIRPTANLPARFSSLHSRSDNATRLAAAGVRLIITTEGPHDLRNLRQEAGNAVAHGLDRDVALRALTVEPARAFNVDDRYGTLTAGRVANLVVWTGDPLEVGTWAREVYIRGRPMSLTTRQSLLFERYRDIERVRRGRPR